MLELVRLQSTSQLLLEQIPTLSGALVIAELFYKFHSFTLECLAFLATWYVIGAVRDTLARLVRR